MKKWYRNIIKDSKTKKRYSLILVDNQPISSNEMAIISYLLSIGNKVCIGIRDTDYGSKTPLETLNLIMQEYSYQISQGTIHACILPDITEFSAIVDGEINVIECITL
jgi:hypothetical protein